MNVANRWVSVLSKFANVQKVYEDLDEAKENKGGVMRPTMIKVWRTYARIG